MKTRLMSLTVLALFMSGIILAPLGMEAAAQGYEVKNNLKNIPVKGAREGTFEGKLEILGFTVDPDGFTVTGILDGTATSSTGPVKVQKQTFTAPVTSFATSATVLQGPNEPGVCDILFLDIGPIFLDLLGLTVDLSEIILDVDAVPGEGNLLGNLLCAIVNLLNP
jgi:hypothetical protein